MIITLLVKSLILIDIVALTIRLDFPKFLISLLPIIITYNDKFIIVLFL